MENSKLMLSGSADQQRDVNELEFEGFSPHNHILSPVLGRAILKDEFYETVDSRKI